MGRGVLGMRRGLGQVEGGRRLEWRRVGDGGLGVGGWRGEGLGGDW